MTDPWTIPSELRPEGPVISAGRYRIRCPDGKTRSYSRVTTFISCLDDRSRLEAWKLRTVLQGMMVDESIGEELKYADPEGREILEKLADRAFTAGRGYEKAKTGTDRHTIAELWDTMSQMPVLSDVEREWLRRYAEAVSQAGLRFLLRERTIVVDRLKVAGTLDAVAEYRCLDGVTRNVVCDLKTRPGALEWGWGERAQQLQLYAEGELYDWETGERSPLPDVSQDVGLILHVAQDNSLPAALYEVPLRMGRHGNALAADVRSWRNYSRKSYHPVPLS